MKTFCPKCEKETNCVYIAELYECKECGCDFESKQRQMQERLDAANARAEAAETRLADRDAEVARLTELRRAASEFIGYIKAGNNARAHLQMLFLEALINEESKNGAKK